MIVSRPCCNQPKPTPPAGLGFTTSSTTSILGSFDWKLWAIVALAALLAYKLFFSPKIADRRARLKSARARYESQVARIKAA